tara:strand:+ start:3569 stop:4252 length:684 start_codon:yes stop_codon:yes gene_type:complete
MAPYDVQGRLLELRETSARKTYSEGLAHIFNLDSNHKQAYTNAIDFLVEKWAQNIYSRRILPLFAENSFVRKANIVDQDTPPQYCYQFSDLGQNIYITSRLVSSVIDREFRVRYNLVNGNKFRIECIIDGEPNFYERDSTGPFFQAKNFGPLWKNYSEGMASKYTTKQGLLRFQGSLLVLGKENGNQPILIYYARDSSGKSFFRFFDLDGEEVFDSVEKRETQRKTK